MENRACDMLHFAVRSIEKSHHEAEGVDSGRAFPAFSFPTGPERSHGQPKENAWPRRKTPGRRATMHWFDGVAIGSTVYFLRWNELGRSPCALGNHGTTTIFSATLVLTEGSGPRTRRGTNCSVTPTRGTSRSINELPLVKPPQRLHKRAIFWSRIATPPLRQQRSKINLTV